MRRIIAFTIFLCSFLPDINGQNPHPTDYFISPLDITLSVSGTFGELRNTHLHSGIDFRTRAVEGLPMKAVADGYVSRIVVSPTGFGKAIYIHHPNGYTSVYAHCRNFNPEIDEWVKSEQYRLESFSVNLFPVAGQFPVKQGEIIAYSGNSGSSMGPHLHFEIRKTNGQIPINPLHFGFEVRDFIRPTIERFVVYPHGNGSSVDGLDKPKEFELAGWGPVYRLSSGDTISVTGNIYFGIETFDRLNDSNNRNGVYSVELYQDSVLVYGYRMDQFSFNETRYVLSLKDYLRFVSDRSRIQRTRIQPNNRLSVYTESGNNGIFRFDEERIYHMQYVVKDARGNESVLTFHIKGSVPGFREAILAAKQPAASNLMHWDKANSFASNGMTLEIPKGALYDTIHFNFSVDSAIADGFSPVYNIHHRHTPLHSFCNLSISPTGLPQHLQDKALIVNVNRNDLNAVGGVWRDNRINARIRDFGRFTVVVDTIAPTITPRNIHDGKDISEQTAIRLTARDDLAGIETIRATMNGQWILMEWDPKNNLLVYQIDERTSQGRNAFRLEVADTRGNQAVYEATLIR